MLTCKKCGYEGSYTGDPCPECGELFALDKNDIAEQRAALARAKEERDHEGIFECYHILADIGETDAEREYAKLIMKGEGGVRDLDLAMSYFYRAAKKNDAHAAYGYSRLVSRASNDTARFWLIYSAILGCEEAYLEVAQEFASCGYQDDAHYFYYLAAACDDVEAIVTMARRYYEGTGVAPCEQYAKWYMDKLRIPPIYAIKLAYKLRHAIAQEPPRATLKNYNGLLRRLAIQAGACGFDTAYIHLSEILSERGDTDAMNVVGMSLIEKGSVDEGLKLLSRSSSSGNFEAHLKAGELYFCGEAVHQSFKTAVFHFEKAGELGSNVGYERAADILSSDEPSVRDVARAIELYELAYVHGSSEAKEKANRIREERERLYRLSCETDGEESFGAAALSADMGYTPAMLRLAELYLYGRGTSINRQSSYYWNKRAVELSDENGYFPLGKCYEEGIGINRNFKKARELYRKAEIAGDIRAGGAAKNLFERKLVKTANALYSSGMRLLHLCKFKEAFVRLSIAAEVNHPKSMYTLGCLYEFGIGVPCNKERAYALYEDSYTLRFRDPRSRYKLIVLKAVKKNEMKFN